MSPVSTSCGISRDQARPLLGLLQAPSAGSRLAAFEALTRLPLEPDAWIAVRDYALAVLGDDAMPEHLDAIEPAGRVPLESVRAALLRLASGSSPEAEQRAALTLAEARDPRAVEPLLRLLGGAVAAAAARALTFLDTTRVASELEERWRSLPPRVEGERIGFWLALAIARSGETGPLEAELGALAKELTALDDDGRPLDFWPDDDRELTAAVARIAPLPREKQAALTLRATSSFVQELVEDLLRAPTELEPARHGPVEPPTRAECDAAIPDPLERRQVRDALGDGLPGHEPYQAPLVAQLADQLYDALGRALPRRRFDVALVSELLRLAASSEGQFGDDAVLLVSSVRPLYVPDVEGLVEAWLLCRSRAALARDQIAWAAGRRGLGFLLEGLARALDAQPRDAARLVAAAADWALSVDPPLMPAGEAMEPPSGTPSAELIDDLTTANGGGLEMPMAAPPAEDTAAARSTRGLPPTERATPDATVPRWILAQVAEVQPDGSRRALQRAFRAGGLHEVAVAIGPAEQGWLAAIGEETFDDALGPRAGTVQLLVVFVPNPALGAPEKASLFLPPAGASRPCTFGLQVPDGLPTVEAQIQVYHENRMIQLALLRGEVTAEPEREGGGIELQLAVIRPSTDGLGDSQRFDGALARTGGRAGDHVTTAVAGEELVVYDDAGIGRVLPTLRRLLSDIATSEAARRGDLADEAVVEHLRALAFQGCDLYREIGAPLFGPRGSQVPERLQVLIESASELFPVELVYDFAPPRQDATLCRDWRAAAKAGRCPSGHEARGREGLADEVCPAGFWALSKVVERQVVGETSWRAQGLQGMDAAIRCQATAQRRTLSPPVSSILAASDRVKPADVASLGRALGRATRSTATASTWNGWVAEIAAVRPSVLVLLSHTTEEQYQAALEISGDLRLIAQMDGRYVRAGEDDLPVVLLLGCETAVSDYGLQSFVARFQDCGAALVVGTIASVLGPRAVVVARTIATELAAASRRRHAVSAGELLRRLRCSLLARGELTALCLTAFGDADWQLGGAG